MKNRIIIENQEELRICDKPLRCLIWGTGNAFRENLQTIRCYELLNKILIYGVTSKDALYRQVFGYDFIDIDKIDPGKFDIVLIMSYSEKYIGEITEEVMEFGIEKYNIIPCNVIRLCGFDFHKYCMLKKNIPSIFAINCWGGLTYHQLGLRFESPFINMFVREEDFLKFLRMPRHYLSADLQLKEMVYEPNSHIDYPLVACDDIELHFNHSTSFAEAKYTWNKRKARVDWDNIFVMFYTEKQLLAKEFCELPYDKKVCFAPFDSEYKEVITIKYKMIKDLKRNPFWRAVDDTGMNRLLCYDIFDLLLYGKITHIVEYLEQSYGE